MSNEEINPLKGNDLFHIQGVLSSLSGFAGEQLDGDAGKDSAPVWRSGRDAIYNASTSLNKARANLRNCGSENVGDPQKLLAFKELLKAVESAINSLKEGYSGSSEGNDQVSLEMEISRDFLEKAVQAIEAQSGVKSSRP